MAEDLTGYEASELERVEALLDAQPDSSEALYYDTIGFDPRAISVVAAKRAGNTGSAFHAAAVALAATDVTISSGGVIPVDQVTIDTDGFYNAEATKIIIPSGLAGVYLIGMIADIYPFNIATQTDFLGTIRTSGNPNNVNAPFGVTLTDGGGSAGVINGSGIMAPLAEGDDLRATVSWSGDGTVGVARSTTLLWCQYLGPAA